MERYFIDTSGVDLKARAEIVGKAFEVAKKLNVSHIILCVPTFGGEWLNGIFEEEVKEQRLRERVPINGIELGLESRNTVNELFFDYVIITMGLRADDLFNFECNRHVKAILALPWIREEIDDWVNGFGVTELRSGVQQEKLQLPCVVEKALEELTESINLSSGITNSYDNDRAKTTVRALNKYNYELSVPAIKAWLIEHYWTQGGMNSFTELVEKVNNGKYFQGGETTGLQHYKNRWEDECN
ncbi:hypothetical protein ACKGJO_05305 [Gracilimonas sp. Q87]|uniref:hypothetical protein n=1 Tax=Gracilimonas sp. Q87 TaxID=3384766 RepID=UPI003983F495